MSEHRPGWQFVEDSGRVIALWRGQQRAAYVLWMTSCAWPADQAWSAVKPFGYPAPGQWKALDGTRATARQEAAIQEAFDVWANQCAHKRDWVRSEIDELYEQHGVTNEPR